MMKLLYIWVPLLVLTACNTNTMDKDTAIPTTSEKSAAGETSDSLRQQQLNDIRKIHNALSEVVHGSVETMIDEFRRSKHRDEKIAIWLNVAAAYEKFAVDKHFEEYDKKKEAFQLLQLRSGVSDEAALPEYDFVYLSKEEISEILRYYEENAVATW